MKKAKFYSEIADGPESVSAYWLQTEDNVRVRLSVYGSEFEPKGTILLMLGRFGYAERYGRVAKSFSDSGFTTAVLDWRSQGLSQRMAVDPQAGHVEHFSDYQKDVAAMMEAVRKLGLPEPYFLVGVSMGACIGLRALLDGLSVTAAAFISPMWGIKMSPVQRAAAWTLSWAFQKVGLGHKYVPGESGDVYVQNTAFDDNNLTFNVRMYDYWVDQAQQVPELHIGGPTMGWLYEALSECRKLSKENSPSTPCIIFCGELDQVVDNMTTKDRVRRWPNSKFVFVRNAKHDVLTEVGNDAMNQMLAFFSRSPNKPN